MICAFVSVALLFSNDVFVVLYIHSWHCPVETVFSVDSKWGACQGSGLHPKWCSCKVAFHKYKFTSACWAELMVLCGVWNEVVSGGVMVANVAFHAVILTRPNLTNCWQIVPYSTQDPISLRSVDIFYRNFIYRTIICTITVPIPMCAWCRTFVRQTNVVLCFVNFYSSGPCKTKQLWSLNRARCQFLETPSLYTGPPANA